MLNTRIEFIDKAKIFNAAEQSDWNVDVMTAKSFMDITARGLERQFEDAIMRPYNEMLEKKRVAPTPTRVAPTPTRRPGLKFVTSIVPSVDRISIGHVVSV